MTYTFDPSLSDDVSLVRFHIGDTVELDHQIEDATIKHFVDSDGVGAAVIKCIQYIIARLSQPDERTGNYSRSNANARAGYEALLKAKAQEFSISLSGVTMSSSVSLPWRADSYMTDGEQDGSP
jgi:hypothetical protein